ncbi:MAG: TadE/TadG family type IV pilus assembly protein [Actinomycetota bacterium]|nr:pilus assembly protein [Actinomycetota bacterium]
MPGADRERGQSTVEFVLLLPFLAAAFAALVEVALLAGDQVRLWHAAREAARVAVVDSDPIQAAVAAESSGLSPLELTIDPDVAHRIQGRPLTVQIRYEPPGHLPLLGLIVRSVDLNATATMRIEQP